MMQVWKKDTNKGQHKMPASEEGVPEVLHLPAQTPTKAKVQIHEPKGPPRLQYHLDYRNK